MRLLPCSLLLLAACGESTAPPPTAPPREIASLEAQPRPGDEVVAEVDGRPIWAADVAAQMRATGQDARAALDALIDQELLAEEARRRGYLADAEVVEAGRRARVRRLLDAVFAPSFDGPEDIPLEAVERVWRHPMVQLHYDHPLTHNVRYVRLEVAAGAPAADDARARALAEKVYTAALAEKPATADDFVRLAQRVTGLPVPGRTQNVWPNSGLVPEFVAAAFSVKAPGDVSRPTRTKWGWDVLYLDSVIPERHTPFAEAAPEIRRQRFEPERAAAFLRWSDTLVRRARIVRDDTWLARIAVDAPLELR